MWNVIDSAQFVLAGCLLIPCVVLSFECFAGSFLRRRTASTDRPRPRVAVVIPAHNEQQAIQQTIRSIQAELNSDDRLLVVADNCDDATVELASRAGAEVIERRDLNARGKGYALAFAVEYLAKEPPEVVVFMDADCRVEQGTIDILAGSSFASGRPTQACYLMPMPSQPQPRDFISSFAVTVKNQVRQVGLSNLGLPCHLNGTGMACPWVALQSVQLATNDLIEDTRMGIDLMVAGYPPLFCHQALVTASLPQKEAAKKNQRTRWEHGQLASCLGHARRLVVESVRQYRPQLMFMALDVCVPPLALLVWLLLGVGSIFLWLTAWLPLGLVTLGIVLVGFSVTISWIRFARPRIPLNSLLSIPFYLAWKVPIYLGFLIHKQSRWIRTDRDFTSTEF